MKLYEEIKPGKKVTIKTNNTETVGTILERHKNLYIVVEEEQSKEQILFALCLIKVVYLHDEKKYIRLQMPFQ